jgi:hypothetical protein
MIYNTEYANDLKLQQDHPCVIRLIREKYLRQPANKELPYQLDHPEKVDSSDGQAKDIRNILKNKVNHMQVLICLKNTFFQPICDLNADQRLFRGVWWIRWRIPL